MFGQNWIYVNNLLKKDFNFCQQKRVRFFAKIWISEKQNPKHPSFLTKNSVVCKNVIFDQIFDFGPHWATLALLICSICGICMFFAIMAFACVEFEYDENANFVSNFRIFHSINQTGINGDYYVSTENYTVAHRNWKSTTFHY